MAKKVIYAIRIETSEGEETVVVTDLSQTNLSREGMFAVYLCPVCGVGEVRTESGFGWYPDSTADPLEVTSPEACEKCSHAPKGHVWCHTCQMYTIAGGLPTCGCR